MIVNGMTSVRVNFLLAFESKYGRKPVATRQELVAFAESWQPDEKGGAGLVLRYPSWLTNPNPNPYKVGKAAYRLPWDELDAWNDLMKGSVPATAPAASTTKSDEIANNLEEIV
jgi:hypothetical protein